ncbi:Ankyrin repeat and death domain-containing protein 1A-like isoform X2 [Oopsacas minuta]|uniref:Ankyrin repeat and death domain-containing protein 1A-like isoform X2 n=1 Tax=Oopsacas minuta TaxID=111878 RepID=A0AAV7JC35_9METZ|nr:Ankyrin repeat and death domain-containing protein 1A-like isoform X2 [Oopsacas minuta]
MARRPHSDRQQNETFEADSIFSSNQRRSDQKSIAKAEIHFDGFSVPKQEEKRNENRPHTSPMQTEIRQYTFEDASQIIGKYARTNDSSYFNQLPIDLKLNSLFTLDKYKNTPLYISLITGAANAFYDFLKLLFNHSVPKQQVARYLNIKNIQGRSAIHLGLLSQNEAIFNSILNTNAVKIDAYDAKLRTIFHYLPETKFKLPDRLRYYEFSVNALNFHDSEGQTPIQIAIEKENVNMFQSYAEMGANLKIWDQKGQYTPLQYAARVGNIDILQYMLTSCDYGDINYQSPDGLTALFLAVSNNHLIAVQLLTKHKADPMILRDGNSILSYTQVNNDTKMRNVLFDSVDRDTDKWIFLNSRIDWESQEQKYWNLG